MSPGEAHRPSVTSVRLFELPLAFTLAYVFDVGPTGVFVSMMLAFSSLAVVSGVVFRRGTWKKKSV